MAKFIHTMIRVGNLDQSMKFYQEVFGLKETHRLEFDDFSLVYLRDVESGAEIELTWNKGQSEYTHGSGYGHAAFVVEDLDQQFNRLLDLNLSPALSRNLKETAFCSHDSFYSGSRWLQNRSIATGWSLPIKKCEHRNRWPGHLPAQNPQDGFIF